MRRLQFLKNVIKGRKKKHITIRFSETVLDGFRRTVGRYPAETGGMLACSENINLIDTWCFDQKSKNTSVSYSYDVEEMTAVFRKWKGEGKRSVGFVHSHPGTYRQPSYDDIVTAWNLMKFFKNDFFYLPILISNRKGLFTLYFFVIRRKGTMLDVNLDYVLGATEDAYETVPFRQWNKTYPIQKLEEYYQTVVCEEEASEVPVHEYFQRIKDVYPKHVLEKVQVIVGVGGARTIAENFARNRFKNFILIDGDRIAPSNIATQGVFISEMGMYKTEAIKRRILDINPEAKVICVNRFLDDEMSDEEFADILENFPDKKATDYLIYGCTDCFEANKRSALLSLKYGIPYIGAGMYRQGLGAEVIFTYPGVTASCPRCLLRSRFEANEEGYINDVTSEGCPSFATERLNTLIGYVALMILMYQEAPGSPYDHMLDEVKDRNFIWIRLSPYLGTSELGITLFDNVFSDPRVSKYTFMDETLWLPQHPDAPEFGVRRCKLCEGVGDLRQLIHKWPDTRKI